MNIKPLFDKVVIEQVEAEEKTSGGILLLAKDQEKPQMVRVLAVGPGGIVDGKEIVMQVKVGDKILYSKYAGSEFKLDGKTVTLTVKTGEKGRFFGSVTNKEVAERFTEMGYSIDKKKITIPAIKNVGSYPATIRISAEETAKITVVINAEQ
jgi:chaperonin GroES